MCTSVQFEPHVDLEKASQYEASLCEKSRCTVIQTFKICFIFHRELCNTSAHDDGCLIQLLHDLLRDLFQRGGHLHNLRLYCKSAISIDHYILTG